MEKQLGTCWLAAKYMLDYLDYIRGADCVPCLCGVVVRLETTTDAWFFDLPFTPEGAE